MQALRQVIEHIMQEVLKKTYIRSWAIRAQEKTHWTDGIMLNITNRDEHVPDIERYIRMVKERARAIVNTLPFDK